MVSRKDLLGSNEMMEWTDLIAAFEVQNKCKITLSGSLELHKGYMDLKWTAEAVSHLSQEKEAYALVYGNVSVWAGDYKTSMAVVSRLLYALDFQLALREFENVAPKKA